MGGYGSGGWNATGRPTIADVPRIDVGQLERAGVLRGYGRGTFRWPAAVPRTELHYTSRPGRIDFEILNPGRGDTQTVMVDWEACRFGGKRPFFVCPECNGRSLHLYCLGHLACRSCHRLSYPSQRERESDRAQRRANRLRQKLAGEPGWQNIPTKPSGMHLSTYKRLVKEIARADAVTDSHASQIVSAKAS